MDKEITKNATDITFFEENMWVLKYTDSKLLFENDRKKAQKYDALFPNSYFVVEWFKKEKDYDIQVVFPLEANWKYNLYLIFIYHWPTQMLYLFGDKSHTPYPPVWDRSFSFGPDYFDCISYQKRINQFLKAKKIPEFEIDESYTGKVVNTSTDHPDKIKELIKEGKPYNILSVWAEAWFKNVKLEKVEKYNN